MLLKLLLNVFCAGLCSLKVTDRSVCNLHLICISAKFQFLFFLVHSGPKLSSEEFKSKGCNYEMTKSTKKGHSQRRGTCIGVIFSCHLTRCQMLGATLGILAEFQPRAGPEKRQLIA